MEENKKQKIKFIYLILVIVLIVFAIFFTFKICLKNSNSNKSANSVNIQSEELEKNENILNRLSNFDLNFLKIENNDENKVYSPLSIKYALSMLSDGCTGNSHSQITKVLGDYELTKYNSSKNMSVANALFINSLFENNVKKSYIAKLKDNYDAEIIFDPFTQAKNINSWISNKTLNLINDIIDDDKVKDSTFILINALGIDMEWENKFLDSNVEKNILKDTNYKHINFYWSSPEYELSKREFGEEKQIVSGMDIVASIDNYDLVKEVGRDNIIKTVSDAYIQYAKDPNEYHDEPEFDADVVTDEIIQEKLNEFLYGKKDIYDKKISEGYLTEIDSNYKNVSMSTDFSLYVDDNVKAFAKDLKEYDGTTLQYIGIMPINENIDEYINSVDDKKINNIINNLKELKNENFKDGVITRITGFIPKFKFEYDLDLKEDLKNLGIKDVFESGKANLTEICDEESTYIEEAVHKANIEFTQDGIKAAAATILGGKGAGEPFDYYYDVPVEDIDLTFDKPYMFLIRDKEKGEVWFAGTVYNPLLWEDEQNNEYDASMYVYPEINK